MFTFSQNGGVSGMQFVNGNGTNGGCIEIVGSYHFTYVFDEINNF